MCLSTKMLYIYPFYKNLSKLHIRTPVLTIIIHHKAITTISKKQGFKKGKSEVKV
jgi:hypothetical protein